MKRRRGATLIDAVVALVILSIALPPLVQSFVEAAAQSVRPQHLAAAVLLANERMEEIIARRCQPGGYAQVDAANFPSESSVTDFPQYSRTTTVTEVAADLVTPQPGSGLKKVVVTVAWESGARQVNAMRLFADY